MIWDIVVKDAHKLSQEKNYRDCKPELAIEAGYKCVYCCIHESRFGGIRNFHVEHFKPKSKFPNLINTYSNLFYSCSICNCFKGNDWPNNHSDKFDKPFYPNPLLINYFDYISVNPSTGFILGKTVTTNYIIEKLYLNRPQLVNERRFYQLMNQLTKNLNCLRELEEKLQKLPKEKKAEIFDSFLETATSVRRITQLQVKLQSISPYTIPQISK
ncbi:HNH endonuclease [Flavobacterium sp. GT3R68]|uniref:HNH endonuclease n=1 Tax=Flavobacterium sp. GT3R68 TaxID=2594437 RepID=UPI000F871FF5|nr:HNH endonuclease [Flavobacterium sp. GT3R68]RTY96039.1 hypothetical protein EKL32_05180 [Flavobacterium sp. GSN2]TRW93812.1 hypothetical protein FNW07_02570 [Flavobacterium sp. GT3R68]